MCAHGFLSLSGGEVPQYVDTLETAMPEALPAEERERGGAR